jgi:hypothetical protein
MLPNALSLSLSLAALPLCLRCVVFLLVLVLCVFGSLVWFPVMVSHHDFTMARERERGKRAKGENWLEVKKRSKKERRKGGKEGGEKLG